MGTHPIFESDFDCLTDRMEVETNFDEILNLHPALSKTENNRIRCGITGHEMPAKIVQVRQHIGGKRFSRLAKEWKKPEEEENNKRKHLETHTKHEGMLYCKLTGRSVSNEEIHIQRHLNGKKFKKALEHWVECEKNEDKEFRPMREWGQRSRQDRDFDDMIGANENGESDDDDCHDLYPWLKNGEKDSGHNEESDAMDEEIEKNASGARKRSKKGSVPIRKKKEKM